MLTLEEAVDRICAQIQLSETEQVPPQIGRVLRADAISELNSPRYDNSAVDGYAVLSSDTVKASTAQPVTLKIAGKAPAGTVYAGRVESGCAIRVFTGSALPDGADAVIMQEDTQIAEPKKHLVNLTCPVTPWENIRFRGEDFKEGQIVLPKGKRLSELDMPLLASAGIQKVDVSKIVKVALVSTGNELVEPGGPLAPGKIYETNRLLLQRRVELLGAMPVLFPIVEDTLQATIKLFQNALHECSYLITTGGVSVGEFDFCKDAFAQLGGTVHFWKVAIKPGKPFVFGKWKDKAWFGLPGNPLSALVTFELLVRPALAASMGASQLSLPRIQAPLGEPMQNLGDRRHFLRAQIGADGLIYSAGLQASHALHALSQTEALLDMPANSTRAKGEVASVLLLKAY